jgi:hypothetical protein
MNSWRDQGAPVAQVLIILITLRHACPMDQDRQGLIILITITKPDVIAKYAKCAKVSAITDLTTDGR